MVKDSETLQAFERQYLQNPDNYVSYKEALAQYASLWKEAQHLGAFNSEFSLKDIQDDIEVARTLNALKYE